LGQTALDWDGALDLMGPPKVEWGSSGNWTYWQYMPPMLNYSRNVSGYPPRSIDRLLDAMQLLLIAPGVDAAKKRLLAIRSVQWGVDLFYMWKGRGFGAMFKTNGGHAVGRYAPTLLAAGLLTGAVGDEMKAGMARMNNGTSDRCGFDVGNVMWYWADTDRITYGVFNIPGCGGYSTYLDQVNSLYVDPEHLGDNGTLSTEGGGNSQMSVDRCSGPYQAINNGPLVATLNLIQGIPALRPIAFELLVPYMKQRLQYGSYCRDDHAPRIYGPMWGRCEGGGNAGWPCTSDASCPSSTCANDGDMQYTSWFALNMLKQYDACYDAKSCAGMEGL
jgi:hypothetical protein